MSGLHSKLAAILEYIRGPQAANGPDLTGADPHAEEYSARESQQPAGPRPVQRGVGRRVHGFEAVDRDQHSYQVFKDDSRRNRLLP